MSLKGINDWIKSLIIPMGTAICLLGFAWVDLKMLENSLNSNPITIGYLISASAFHLFWGIWLGFSTITKKAGK